MGRWKHRLQTHGFDVNGFRWLTNIRYADDVIFLIK